MIDNLLYTAVRIKSSVNRNDYPGNEGGKVGE